MANKIREMGGRLADRLEDSPFIVPITLTFIVVFLASVRISIADFNTSLKGYEAIPTRKGGGALLLYAVAILPQLGQIVFAYTFADEDHGRDWMLGAAILLFMVDAGTDVYYKASGGEPWVWMVALFESIAVYTLGSELLLILTSGMLLQLIPAFWAQIEKMLGGAANKARQTSKPRQSTQEQRQGQQRRGGGQ